MTDPVATEAIVDDFYLSGPGQKTSHGFLVAEKRYAVL